MIKIVDIQQLYLDYWLLAQLYYLTTLNAPTKTGCPLMDKVCKDIWDDILNAFITPRVGAEGYITWQVLSGHTHGFINAAQEEEETWN